MSAKTGNVLLGAGVVFFAYYLWKKKKAGPVRVDTNGTWTDSSSSGLLSGFGFSTDNASSNPKLAAVDFSNLIADYNLG